MYPELHYLESSSINNEFINNQSVDNDSIYSQWKDSQSLERRLMGNINVHDIIMNDISELQSTTDSRINKYENYPNLLASPRRNDNDNDNNNNNRYHENNVNSLTSQTGIRSLFDSIVTDDTNPELDEYFEPKISTQIPPYIPVGSIDDRKAAHRYYQHLYKKEEYYLCTKKERLTMMILRMLSDYRIQYLLTSTYRRFFSTIYPFSLIVANG
jgi:hypothetical protein